ncbi:MAG: hypothetical protein GXY83_25725 [Rhodopirellula sp.]|nr:hypothetical protein [Rhodopirellula sp.]
MTQSAAKTAAGREITVDFIKEHYGADVLLNGFSQDFPRDNMAVIGNNVIEFNLRTPIRKVDISGFRDILSERCSDSTVKWFSMPHTELLEPARADTPFLEGGDVIVLGRTVLVGNTENPSVGSNDENARKSKKVTLAMFSTLPLPKLPGARRKGNSKKTQDKSNLIVSGRIQDDHLGR